MTTTWNNVRAILESKYGLKHERGDQWRCMKGSPVRAGSDGNSFTINVSSDGEHGVWKDHNDDQSGSLYGLAKEIGAKIERAYTDVQTTKRGYRNLAEYAEAHGVPEQAYLDARWSSEIVTIHNRPALEFITQGGKRWRFLDGQKPSFMSEPGYKQCWYGLVKAVQKSKETGQALVLCNGEPSVVAAQWHGLAACTITSGEKGTYPAALLDQLKAAYTGKVIIALDCDYKGTKSAFELEKQLQSIGIDAEAIDLGLGDSGDIADFCTLHTVKAVESLSACKHLEAKNLPPEQMVLQAGKPQLVNLDDLYCSDIDALKAYIDDIQGEVIPKAAPMVMPFEFLHACGGMGKIIPAGKVVYFASISGGTKTIGFETGWEYCQDRGIHSIVYSPEWVDGDSNAIEFAARSVQRSGGAHFDSWLSNRLAVAEQAFNMPRPSGQFLDPYAVGKSVSFANNLMRKPGRVFYIKKPGLSAEQLAEMIAAICDREAKNGIIIRAVWVDYAQTLWLQNNDTGRMWIEAAIGLIKDVARSKNLVGFISSQMRKDDAELAKTNGKIDASDMQWLSSQQCNFLLAFVPKYEDGKQVFVPKPGNFHEKLGLLRGYDLKNSTAPLTGKEIVIPVDFSRLIWMDRAG